MIPDLRWTALTGTASNMTGTSVITGAAGLIWGLSRATFQCIWTGTPNGTFTFQVCDYDGAIYDSAGSYLSTVTWSTLTNPSGFTALQPAGSASNSSFNLADLSNKWIRPIYTNASSTGTLTFIYASARH